MQTNDGCLVRGRGQQKTASAHVYLMEELGDARMRCDQLVRYVAEATKLIENSSHRDHFFEVAGHLIQGIPQTLFKLQKALQAVALAATRIDYEEIKQELRPEKVEQLEQVLQDVRIRQVQRRSEPWTPAQAAGQLRALAAKVNETGWLDRGDLINLVLGLEVGSKKASEFDTSSVLETLADAVETSEDMSRLRLAALLRRILADEILNIGGEAAKDELRDSMNHTAQDWKAADDEEKESRFEEGKPADPTKNMSPEDKAKWKKQNEEHKDKFKSGAAELPAKFDPNYQQQLSLMMKNPPKVNTRDEGVVIEVFSPFVKKYIPMAEYPSSETAEKDLGVWMRAHRETLQNLRKAIQSEGKTAYSFSSEDEEKESRFEEGKPADPTKNMSPEDAKKWKQQKEEHKDKFKAAADPWKVDAEEDEPPFGREMVEQGLEKALTSMKRAQVAWQAGNSKKMFFGLLSVLDGLGMVGRAYDLPDVGYLMRVWKAFAKMSGSKPTTNFTAAEIREAAARFGRGVTPEKLSKMLYDTAEHIYKARGATRELGDLLQECLEGQPFGEGPLSGADDNVLRRIETAKKERHNWDFQGGSAASALEAAGRDVKKVPSK